MFDYKSSSTGAFALAMESRGTLRDALTLAGQGFAPFAAHGVRVLTDGTFACGCGHPDCGAPGKAPFESFVTSGLPLRHPQEIAGRWRLAAQRMGDCYVEPNIAIATGHPHGYVVIDVDPKDGGYATLQELETLYGVLPDTLAVVTGSGGRHLYFREARPLRGGRPGMLGPGIDIKAFHAYVIGPGSLHKSGRRYFWVPGFGPGEIEMAKLPEAWCEAIHQGALAGSAAKRSRPAVVPAGSRFDRWTAERIVVAVIGHRAWQWATENADEVGRPTWMGFATNMVTACAGHREVVDDGRMAFHRLSEGHHGYQVRQTDRVYDDAIHFIAKGGGPHRWTSMPDVPESLRGVATTLVGEVRNSIFRK